MGIDNYVLYRADRTSRGGGVATYVDTNLVSECVSPNVEPTNLECLFTNIIFHENKQLTIVNIYRPPSAPSDSLNYILATINSLDRHNEQIILGDFNNNWLDRSSSGDRNLLGSVSLTQLIKEPTRVDGRSSTLLDWILVSNPDRIIKSGVLSDCFSDHSIIYCIWKIKIQSSPYKYITIRQCKNINVDYYIRDLLDIRWDRLQLIPLVEEAWNFFYTEVKTVIDKHAPVRTIKVKGRHLPWINCNLLQLFKQRDKAWVKYRLSKDESDGTIYKQLRNKCKTETRNAKSNYYRDCFSRDFNNPRHFWNHLNNILNKNKKTPVKQICKDNDILSDPLLIAHAFNHNFSSLCSLKSVCPDGLAWSSCSSMPAGSFSFKKIMPTNVFKVLQDLQLKCSIGPDDLEAKFVKIAAHILMFPLADLFNLSLTTCNVPQIWKAARVTPLFKGGDQSDVNNYRPIFIICAVAKIFEKLIFNQLSTLIIITFYLHINLALDLIFLLQLLF